ncbi:MAG: cytochrome c [Candidatus Campbellbacteria bacterium]|nr:cytochrome c [Candidatus Campbellbacteria bacterium]
MAISCSGKSKKANARAVSPDSVKKELSAVIPAADLSNHPGKQLYAKQCLPCHQADGSGVPGMFPPLDKEWVDGDNETLISIVVHGMDGEIEVNGEIYNQIMAPLPHLSDQEVKDVLNYVRMEFGSSDNEISTAEVREVRNSGSGKKGYQ